MKCSRCHKEVPVLTPSPEGDQDLCEECYAAVYEALTKARRSSRGTFFGAVILAAVAVAAAWYFFTSGDKAGPEAPPAAQVPDLGGPNKPQPGKVAQRTTRRRAQFRRSAPQRPRVPTSRKKAPPQKAPASVTEPPRELPEETASHSPTEELSPAEGATEETPKEQRAPLARPEEAIPRGESKVFSTEELQLTYGSAWIVDHISVVPADLPEGTEPPVLGSEDMKLVEISWALVPRTETELVFSPPVLLSGEEVFSALQAKAFTEPYRAPHAEAIEFAPRARIAFFFGAKEDTVEAVAQGAGVSELIVSRRTRSDRIPLVLLYAVPRDSGPSYQLALGDQQFAVTLSGGKPPEGQSGTEEEKGEEH